MVPPIASSPTIDLSYMHNDSGSSEGLLGGSLTFLTKTLEVYELSSYRLLPQAPASFQLAQALGLSQPHQSTDISAAVQIDASLKRWEKGLPSSLGCEPVQGDATEGFLESQRILLHLRYVNKLRTCLHRPTDIPKAPGQRCHHLAAHSGIFIQDASLLTQPH